jgi:hypothetical protein
VALLPTLGLWGDGDEIWAIEGAFKALDLKVPVEEAQKWVTVGDLWESVIRLAPDVGANPNSWDSFRIALSDETGVDWTEVALATTLIDGRGHNVMSRLFNKLREKMKKALEHA